VIQDRRFRRLRLIVVRRKPSAEQRLNLQGPQGSRRNEQCAGLLGLPYPGDCSLAAAEDSQLLECLAVAQIGLEHLRRDREGIVAHAPE
jgi:hypothetical protein